jgi:hypothetical protein
MYRIVFHGKVRDGHEVASVREQLARLFRIEDSERLDKLFSGSPVTIKKSLDEAGARKYITALEKAGAEVEVDPPLPGAAEDLADFADFPSMPSSDQDLSFQTVMQSFSNEAPLAAEPGQADENMAADEQDFPPLRRRAWWPLAAGAAAALVVSAGFILWPTGPAPLSPVEQANMEQLFAIAGEGNDEQFQAAIANVDDPDLLNALYELRAAMQSVQDIPTDDPLPEFDMQALRAIAENSSDAEFEAAVQAEADVDARRILLELREQRGGRTGPASE